MGNINTRISLVACCHEPNGMEATRWNASFLRTTLYLVYDMTVVTLLAASFISLALVNTYRAYSIKMEAYRLAEPDKVNLIYDHIPLLIK